MARSLMLLRPYQWLKNGFVLVGVLFSKRWDPKTLVLAGMAFFAFCAIASAVYVINDVFDIDPSHQNAIL